MVLYMKARRQLEMAVRDLEELGFATMPVPTAITTTVARGFCIARSAFDVLEDGPPSLGPHTTNSANASGSHRIGALSNYNACREGFIFSNGASFEVHGVDGFEAAMGSFFDAAIETAHALLEAIERRLQLPEQWFESALGPLKDSSQWHMKRYRPEAAPQHAVTSDGKLVLLAVHSDPSLISLIFHDRPGCSPGAMGLECQVTGGDGKLAWSPIASHGHSVVTILAGSVLDKLTCGTYRAVRHRVAVPHATYMNSGKRVAATFFFRPAPSAMLQPPPSPLLRRLPSGGQGMMGMRYAEWQKKVAAKYEKHAPPTDFAKAAKPAARGTVAAAAEEAGARPPDGKVEADDAMRTRVPTVAISLRAASAISLRAIKVRIS